MQMLSQRLAKASSLALQGNSIAFKQMRDSHSQFATNLDRLMNGGELAGTSVPPSPDNVQPPLQALAKAWSATDKDSVQMLDMENYLVKLGQDVTDIIEKNSQMLFLAEQVAALQTAKRRKRWRNRRCQPDGDVDAADRQERQCVVGWR